MINVFSGIDDKDDPNSQYYIKLNSCDRLNNKQQWELISLGWSKFSILHKIK